MKYRLTWLSFSVMQRGYATGEHGIAGLYDREFDSLCIAVLSYQECRNDPDTAQVVLSSFDEDGIEAYISKSWEIPLYEQP